MASSATSGGLSGRNSVTATFDGANHAERAIDELKKAGFKAEQVSADVNQGEGGGGATSEAAGTSLAAGLGLVLGAIIGGVLGWQLLDGTLPIILGAIVGAIAGTAIASAIARAAAKSQTASSAGGTRKGSVRLTVNADSPQQAQQARALFERFGAKLGG